MYDITDRDSFEAIPEWITQVNNSTNDNVVFLLVGNKYDRHTKREVSEREGVKMAKNINAAFYETSAHTGYNVQTSMDELMHVLLKSVYDMSISGGKQEYQKHTVLSATAQSSYDRSIRLEKPR